MKELIKIFHRRTTSQQADSAEKELSNLIPRSQELEESLFTIWEEIESLQEIIDEESNYKTGAAKSIEKLKQEISELVKDKELDIEKYLKRKDELLKQLPAGFGRHFPTDRKK